MNVTIPTVFILPNQNTPTANVWKQFQPQTDITAYELAQIVPHINGSIMVSPQQWAGLSPTLQRHFVDAPSLQFYPSDQNGVMVVKG